MGKEPVNPYSPPTTQGELQADGPTDYASVPVLRRNGFCSGVILAHVAVMFLGGCIVPYFALLGVVTTVGVLVVCVTVLTGPVYYNKLDPNGRLKTWGSSNKVAAVIILVLFIGLYGFIMYFIWMRA